MRQPGGWRQVGEVRLDRTAVRAAQAAVCAGIVVAPLAYRLTLGVLAVVRTVSLALVLTTLLVPAALARPLSSSTLNVGGVEVQVGSSTPHVPVCDLGPVASRPVGRVRIRL